MPPERLTRHEISWLLAQEARGAAKSLRTEVVQRRAPSDPHRLGEPVETTLDALDDTIEMLSALNVGGRNKGRRGRIDLAALLVEIAPNARVALEPGAGTEVFGDEGELRRMLHLLVAQASGRTPGESNIPVRIRRQGSAVILEPVADDWAWLDAIAGKLDDDFARAVEEKPGPQARPGLDRLFR